MNRYEIKYKTSKWGETKIATVVAPSENEATESLKDVERYEGRKAKIILVEDQGIIAGHHVSLVQRIEL